MSTNEQKQHENDRKIILAMIERGGHFLSNLGRAAQYADSENLRKIKNSWPEYWKEFADYAGVTIES